MNPAVRSKTLSDMISSSRYALVQRPCLHRLRVRGLREGMTRSSRDIPRLPIKQAVTSCPAERPRVTKARAECAPSCVSLHPSQPSARKIGATCHPRRIRLALLGGTLTHPIAGEYLMHL